MTAQTPDAPEGGHTPGPWLTQLVETEGPDFGVPIIGDNLGGLVGYALPWPTEIESGDYSRVIANARLIAAAPELLEALKLWVAYDQGDEDNGLDLMLAYDRALAATRAALTKAGPQ